MSPQDDHGLEIAIVGMAGRFPGASSLGDFWANLRDGVEGIRDFSEAELRAAGVGEPELADPRYVRRGADLRDIALFDASLFGFTPREAELTDPQFRVFLEDAWAALEDAGHLTDRHDLRVGVFAGASPNSYFSSNILSNPLAAQAVGAFQTALGNERDYLATQVSYRLDLRGPSLLVQTACSTSLVAVHLACQSLIGRECDVALAGGVSISVPQESGYLHEEGDIASPDGRCRAFDAAAAGCVKGNGSGVVVLRRLADALRDGDSIRAVIKGSAVNNDGSGKVGFTAPGVEGQADVIAEALAVAGVDPATVTYVEAHGTATPLGDPVEVAALARAFGPGTREARCALGSLKTGIGHLDAAAGVAGLIKTVLSLQHREIPPSLHFDRPNPAIDFPATPFFVNTQRRPWDRNGAPRRAGVSSFGIGGTNAHVVLEEAPDPALPAPAREAAPQLLVLSGASERAVEQMAEALAFRLEEPDAPGLADAAFTLQAGRKRLPWRRTLAVRDAHEAVAALRHAPGAAAIRHDERRGTDVAFLFPGQGAQHAGMGRVLHREEPVYREAFDRCAETLRPLLGIDPGEAVLGTGAEADARLRETRLAQPALFCVSYALARLWISWGIRPSAMAGHSVGEYVAACLAGVMTLDDALALVAERGRMMGSLPPGAMLSVPLSEQDVAALIEPLPSLALAAINGPASCVVSGPEESIVRLETELSSRDVPSRRLRTSHAFHSPMMDPILAAFEERVRRVRLSPPGVPFLSNVSGTWITAGEATDPSYWARHIRRPVRFADQVAALAADPSRALLEVGPGTTLASLARLQAGRDLTIVSSMGHAKDGGDDRLAALEAAGRLWSAGADLDWQAMHAGRPRRRVPLPTYPFQRQRYWIDPAPAGSGATAKEQASEKNPDLSAWFHVPGWKRSVARPAPSAAPQAPWLLFDDGSALARAVAEAAASRGARVIAVRAGDAYARPEPEVFIVDPRRHEDFEAMARDLNASDLLPGRIVHLWCASPATDPGRAQDLGFHALVSAVRTLVPPAGAAGLRMIAVTRGLQDVAGDRVECPERATLTGVCRVAPQEVPGLTCRLVDVEAGDEAAAAARIAIELDADDREPVTAWRGGHRWIPSFTAVRLDPVEGEPGIARAGGVYVMTGGTGPIEIAIARRLAGAGAAAIAFLECGPDAAGAAEALRAGGARVLCFEARTTDPAALARAMDELRGLSGRIDAIFHTAGSIGGGMIQLKERAAADRVMAPRVEGARRLAALARGGETLVLFSSAISSTGVFGQVDYCAASAFMDAFAHSRSRGSEGPRVVTIDWGMALWDRWQEASGPAAEALLEQLRAVQRSVGITVEEGVDVLWRALSMSEPQVVVCTQDLAELVAQARDASVADYLQEVRPAGRAGGGPGDLSSETERRVAEVWSALLGIPHVGRSDNFFELGGNSLLAIQLASQLRKSFGIELTIASLFESADLAGLAAAVDRAIEERRSAEEVARLLDEIESLSEEQIRVELDRAADAKEEAIP